MRTAFGISAACCVAFGVSCDGQQLAKKEAKAPPGVYLAVANKRLTVVPKGQWKSPFTVFRFAVLDNGEVVAPILRVTQKKFSGPMGELQDFETWQQIGMSIGEGSPHIDLPSEKKFVKYLIMLTPLDGPGKISKEPWRVWEVSFEEAWKKAPPSIEPPVFQQLPLFKDRPDKDELIERIEAAEAFRIRLRQ